MLPKRYASRVVEISSMQLNESSRDDILSWIRDSGGVASAFAENGNIVINTLEGQMTASPGDWIIQGTEGEFYPCKPSVFERKYELAKRDGDHMVRLEFHLDEEVTPNIFAKKIAWACIRGGALRAGEYIRVPSTWATFHATIRDESNECDGCGESFDKPCSCEDCERTPEDE